MKNLNLVNSLWNNCKSGIKRISYLILLISFICLNSALFCQNTVDIKASASGNINCLNTLVRLECNIKGEDAICKWTGPNGYLSTSKNPETTIPGVYTVSVINPQTKTISTANVTVMLDTMPPTGVTAVTSSLLTCKDTLVTLTGNSTTQDVVYNWQGPEDFTSSEKKLLTSIPGIYLLTVTNPDNGCTTKANKTEG